MGIIVVGGVIEKDGKFLLVQEAKKPFSGQWNLPAGRLEIDESVFDGAKREIEEETGYKVELTGIVQISNKTLIIESLNVKDSLISIIFSTKILSGDINYNPSELLAVKWFTYDEILNMKDKLRSSNWIINAIMVFIVACIVTIGINYLFYKNEFKELDIIMKRLIKKK